jgi:hypothetical protein
MTEAPTAAGVERRHPEPAAADLLQLAQAIVGCEERAAHRLDETNRKQHRRGKSGAAAHAAFRSQSIRRSHPPAR